MKPGTLVVAILTAIVSMSVAIWAMKTEPPQKPSLLPPTQSTDVVQVSPTGPYPKAVIGKSTYNFGVMEARQKGEHTFVIRNEGEAPLKLLSRPEDKTCTCTVSSMNGEAIPPGKSAEVRLEWKPPITLEHFRQTAKVHTNDPTNKIIELVIEGTIKSRLVLHPPEGWGFGRIGDDKPSEFTGYVFSPVLKEFKILAVSSTHPKLTGTATPLTPMELKTFTHLKVKSGYAIHVKLQTGMAVGRFELPLTIKTDVQETDESGKLTAPIAITVTVSGNHEGPIQILGPSWNEEQMTVVVGTFDSAAGKKVTLNLFAAGVPSDGLKILNVESIPKELKVTLQPDPRIKGKKSAYLLNFEFPPGTARTLVDDDGVGSVKLQTNHPHAPKIDFRIRYRAI